MYDKYFIKVWAASEFPYIRKSQETFMKGCLRGNFSLRKCTQSSVHQPLSGLGTVARLGGVPHEGGVWGLSSHLMKAVLGQSLADHNSFPTQGMKKIL